MNLSKRSTIDYPRGLRANLEYRISLFEACDRDVKLKADYREMCKKDIIFWINTSCWTRDPRRNPSDMPFITYDAYQEEHILEIQKAIEEGYDLLDEKSRDMGDSWMVLYVFEHFWQFYDGSDFRVGSRKEEFVDKIGDMDTLFEKLRFNIRKQPVWLLPEGFDIDNKKYSSYMRLLNPNGSTIIGESANPNFGTGGRRKAVLLDEFAKWEPSVAEPAWTSLGDVTKCRIAVSTPFGSGNKHATLANGEFGVNIKKVTLHWTLHPTKSEGAYYVSGGNKVPIDLTKDPKRAFKIWLLNRGKLLKGGKGGVVRSPWYDKECERRTDREIAQELDIDYLRSGNPFFDSTGMARQLKWEYFERKLPSDPIPHGKFITAKLIKVGNKIMMREDSNGWLRIFEFPKQGYQYAGGIDTAEGLPKGDLSVAIFREKITTNTVASIIGLYDPEVIAEYSWLTHLYYNDAILAPENNNMGYSTAKELEDLGTNLYYTIQEETKDGDKQTSKRGFTTNRATRLPMLNEMNREMKGMNTELRDPDLISQCFTFIRPERNSNHPEADGTFKDDAVIAFAICGHAIQKHPYKAKAVRSSGSARVQVESRQRQKNAGFGYG